MSDWKKEDRIMIEVEVNKESLIGLVAKAQSLNEDLQRTLTEIGRMLKAKEVPAE